MDGNELFRVVRRRPREPVSKALLPIRRASQRDPLQDRIEAAVLKSAGGLSKRRRAVDFGPVPTALRAEVHWSVAEFDGRAVRASPARIHLQLLVAQKLRRGHFHCASDTQD